MLREEQIQSVQNMAAGIRKRTLGLALSRGEGYIAQAFSSAELFGVLFQCVLQFNALEKPLVPHAFRSVPHAGFNETGMDYYGAAAPDKDRFFLSATQYSVVLYCALVETGRMAESGLEMFNINGSVVEMIGASHSPGMEVMSGSLGQTLSQAVGVAIARKRRGDTGRVVVFMGDGELQSGQTWEAVQCMNHYHLDNMLLVVDINSCQVDGATKDIMELPTPAKRFEAFGMNTHEVDAHDIEAVFKACEDKKSGQPTVVLAYSDVCRGMELMRERAPKFHFIRFTDDMEKQRYQAFYDQMPAAQNKAEDHA